MIKEIELTVEPNKARLIVDGVDISNSVTRCWLSKIDGKNVPMLTLECPFINGRIKIKDNVLLFANGYQISDIRPMEDDDTIEKGRS